MFCTTLTSAPAAMARLAAVCRSECGVAPRPPSRRGGRRDQGPGITGGVSEDFDLGKDEKDLPIRGGPR
jgi:hypothetical protein